MPSHVYNHENRVALYQAIVKHYGPYNANQWHEAPGKPKCPLAPAGWSSPHQEEVFDAIYEELLEKGVFFNKIPKSPTALKQQLAWCMTTQSPENMDPAQTKIMHANRLAAYEAGFITFNDIFNIEKLTRERLFWGLEESAGPVSLRQMVMAEVADYMEPTHDILKENGVDVDSFLEGLMGTIGKYF